MLYVSRKDERLRKNFRKVVLALGLCLALSACGDDEEKSSSEKKREKTTVATSEEKTTSEKSDSTTKEAKDSTSKTQQDKEISAKIEKEMYIVDGLDYDEEEFVGFEVVSSEFKTINGEKCLVVNASVRNILSSDSILQIGDGIHDLAFQNGISLEPLKEYEGTTKKEQLEQFKNKVKGLGSVNVTYAYKLLDDSDVIFLFYNDYGNCCVFSELIENETRSAKPSVIYDPENIIENVAFVDVNPDPDGISPSRPEYILLDILMTNNSDRISYTDASYAPAYGEKDILELELTQNGTKLSDMTLSSGVDQMKDVDVRGVALLPGYSYSRRYVFYLADSEGVVNLKAFGHKYGSLHGSRELDPIEVINKEIPIKMD